MAENHCARDEGNGIAWVRVSPHEPTPPQRPIPAPQASRPNAGSTVVDVRTLTADETRTRIDTLAHLLKDAVDGDAGLGFLPPLPLEEAKAYWTARAADVASGAAVLVVAEDGGRVVGSAQLELSRRSNGRHRAEVTKVMVHSAARRRGIGRALMDALDREARRHGRSLLHLDAFRGDAAEQLYLASGYTFCGIIPEYSLRADGKAHATAIYWKLLR